MKRKVLVVFSLVVVVVVGLSAAAAAAQGGGARSMLRATLEVDQEYFAAVEPINLTFTLENLSAASVRVLPWQLPGDDMEADLLDVRLDGRPVTYLGPLVKRPAPTATDYLEIKPGEAFKAVFDPSSVYDMAAQGSYTIVFRSNLNALAENRTPDGPEPGTSKRGGVEAVVSNPVVLFSEGVQLDEMPGTDEKYIGGYTKCTTSQIAILQTAHANAATISSKSISHLAANPSGSALYEWWFGAFTSTRFNLVKAHYPAIYDAFVNKSVTYNCSCKKPYYAYVYPSKPYTIYLCKVFWQAPDLGRDSKAGTLVHEMSHFYVTASTDDYVYGATGAHNLALTDPDKAVDNADNHEYFAEDQP